MGGVGGIAVRPLGTTGVIGSRRSQPRQLELLKSSSCREKVREMQRHFAEVFGTAGNGAGRGWQETWQEAEQQSLLWQEAAETPVLPAETLLHQLRPGPDDPETGRALHQTSRVRRIKNSVFP